MSTRKARTGVAIDNPGPMTEVQLEGTALQVLGVADMVRPLALAELSRALAALAPADGDARLGRLGPSELRAVSRLIDPLLRFQSLADHIRRGE